MSQQQYKKEKKDDDGDEEETVRTCRRCWGRRCTLPFTVLYILLEMCNTFLVMLLNEQIAIETIETIEWTRMCCYKMVNPVDPLAKTKNTNLNTPTHNTKFR